MINQPPNNRFNWVSGKVDKLVDLLYAEYENNKKLKAIIFVKDRSVATYLKKILDDQFRKRA